MADGNPYMGVMSGQIRKDDQEIINLADIYDAIFLSNRLIVGAETDRKIEQGEAFGAGYVWSTVASDGVINLHFFTGDEPVMVSFSVNATGLTDYWAIFGTTVTGNGAAVPIFSRNGELALAADSTVFRDATYTGGTVAIPRFIGGGTNPTSRVGGSASEQSSYVPANAHVIVYAKNVSGAAQARMGIALEWYEHG